MRLPFTVRWRDTHAQTLDSVWTTVPQKSMAFAVFMHNVERLQHMPAAWTDPFLPDVQVGRTARV
jgi:hypothetical protein